MSAPILMYHSVSHLEDDPNRLCVSPGRFEEQMRYLKRRGLRGVSMCELRRAADARGLVGLTFDDGYEDFLYTAVPILEEYGFSATVFAVTGLLGTENDWEHYLLPRPRMGLLGAEGLREVSERGMEVGAHTMTHPSLCGLEPGPLQREVSHSRRVLSEALGGAVEGFCYPYGDIDGAASRAVREAGYAYACGIFRRIGRDGYDLPRIDVSERDGLPVFAAKLGAPRQYLTVKRLYSRYRGIVRGPR